ncbi:MAG: hypothetical protein AAF960_16945 [Bacteroidota bacterium]
MKKYIPFLIFPFVLIAANCAEEPMLTVEPLEEITPIMIEKYGRTWLAYAQVDKRGNYFRRMFLEITDSDYLTKDGELPNGALIAMETWFGDDQSTVYLRQLVDGEWLSGSFSPTSPNYSLDVSRSCDNCHASANSQQATFTRSLIRPAFTEGTVQIVECDESSFTPCELSVYQ